MKNKLKESKNDNDNYFFIPQLFLDNCAEQLEMFFYSKFRKKIENDESCEFPKFEDLINLYGFSKGFIVKGIYNKKLFTIEKTGHLTLFNI